MDLKTKLAQLNRIYGHHQAFFAERSVACHKFCAACCTCNVTLTTLEGYLIAATLDVSSQFDQMPAIKRTLEGQRFQPQLTINGLAALCMQDKAVPEEACDPRWGTCPFLVEDACTIYDVRPFGCRAMMSVSDCRQTGYADMDELALTVNNVFLQAIEHLDHTGLSGNLSDMIDYFMIDGTLDAYRDNGLPQPAKGLIQNQPIQILMIPPDHRADVEPLLRSLGFLIE